MGQKLKPKPAAYILFAKISKMFVPENILQHFEIIKMKKFTLLLLPLTLYFLPFTLFAQHINIHNYSHNVDEVKIYYTLHTESPDDAHNIKLFLYSESNNWFIMCQKGVSGDICNVRQGNRTIIYKPSEEDFHLKEIHLYYNIVVDNNEYGSVTGISGKVYKTINIGTQIWMAENLDEINYDTKSEQAGLTLSTSLSAIYTPYFTNASIPNRGKLYNWSAAVGIEDGRNQTSEFTSMRQGICPNGWHIPTGEEWTTLSTYLENDTVKQLITPYGWTDFGMDKNSNSSGFSALRTGFALGNKVHSDYCAYFLSASALDSINADIRYLCTDFMNLYPGNKGDKDGAVSLRCVKD